MIKVIIPGRQGGKNLKKAEELLREKIEKGEISIQSDAELWKELKSLRKDGRSFRLLDLPIEFIDKITEIRTGSIAVQIPRISKTTVCCTDKS